MFLQLLIVYNEMYIYIGIRFYSIDSLKFGNKYHFYVTIVLDLLQPNIFTSKNENKMNFVHSNYLF